MGAVAQRVFYDVSPRYRNNMRVNTRTAGAIALAPSLTPSQIRPHWNG